MTIGDMPNYHQHIVVLLVTRDDALDVLGPFDSITAANLAARELKAKYPMFNLHFRSVQVRLDLNQVLWRKPKPKPKGDSHVVDGNLDR